MTPGLTIWSDRLPPGLTPGLTGHMIAVVCARTPSCTAACGDMCNQVPTEGGDVHRQKPSPHRMAPAHSTWMLRKVRATQAAAVGARTVSPK